MKYRNSVCLSACTVAWIWRFVYLNKNVYYGIEHILDTQHPKPSYCKAGNVSIYVLPFYRTPRNPISDVIKMTCNIQNLHIRLNFVTIIFLSFITRLSKPDPAYKFNKVLERFFLGLDLTVKKRVIIIDRNIDSNSTPFSNIRRKDQSQFRTSRRLALDIIHRK